jgi:uncharacterized circularly permuted ATP-grasp superfamily protein
MNERLKELADKALDQTMPETWFGISPDDLDRITKKLAELIVKEMLQTCDDHPAWTGRMIGEKIKEDFGVEQ